MESPIPRTKGEVPSETPIWRYMDIPKFVAMLASKTQWFAKAALFEDGYEGFCRVSPREMPLNDPLARCITGTTGEGATELISLTQMLVDVSKRSTAYFENAREHLYANSWCLADESMAMWQIYGSAGCGIALRSSIGRYRRAAKFNVREEQFAFDMVEYDIDPGLNPGLKFDFREGPVPVPGFGVWERVLRIAFHKRKCFEYEREWRAALYQDARPECSGCNIEFDLNELISAVYLGPRADNFLFDEVDSVMQKFELTKPLERSGLLQSPERTTAAT
jgi:hypothetical protein